MGLEAVPQVVRSEGQLPLPVLNHTKRSLPNSIPRLPVLPEPAAIRAQKAAFHPQARLESDPNPGPPLQDAHIATGPDQISAGCPPGGLPARADFARSTHAALSNKPHPPKFSHLLPFRLQWASG